MSISEWILNEQKGKFLEGTKFLDENAIRNDLLEPGMQLELFFALLKTYHEECSDSTGYASGC